MVDKECDIIVKIGLPTDSGNQSDNREHIWFKLLETDGDRLRAQLLQEPYDISSLHEGDCGWYSADQISDWKIICKEMSVVPDTAYLLI